MVPVTIYCGTVSGDTVLMSQLSGEVCLSVDFGYLLYIINYLIGSRNAMIL